MKKNTTILLVILSIAIITAIVIYLNQKKCPFESIEFMEINENYDENTELEATLKIEAELEKFKKLGDIDGAFESLANFTSGKNGTRKFSVSREYFQEYKAHTTSICALYKLLNDTETLSEGTIRQRAENQILNMIENLSKIKHVEKSSQIEEVPIKQQFHHAIIDKKIEDVEKFLTNGFNINQVLNNEGQSAIHIAAKNGDANMINLLKRFNAELAVKDSSGRFPLELISKEEHPTAYSQLYDIEYRRAMFYKCIETSPQETKAGKCCDHVFDDEVPEC